MRQSLLTFMEDYEQPEQYCSRCVRCAFPDRVRSRSRSLMVQRTAVSSMTLALTTAPGGGRTGPERCPRCALDAEPDHH